MASLKWSSSDAVWIEEVDDEHKEIFAALAEFKKVSSRTGTPADIRKSLERLTESMAGHFAHEERLMDAAQYYALNWHKRLHGAVMRKVGQFAAAIEEGDRNAPRAMAKYLASWLRNHTRLADRMMGAYLRNERRSVGKIVFRAGTKAADACSWVDSMGNRFDPLATTNGL